MITRRDVLFCAAPAFLRGAAEVPPLDLAAVRPADFMDDDVDLPFYLVHFQRLANSVKMDGPDRGFIALPVWRNEKDNQPYNARIMENLLSLAWFYTTPRKWNPYRGHPAVRARLEAALDFWCRIQSPDGRYSEYKPQGWNLAATAFATKFTGEALRLLKNGPPIAPAVHQRTIECCRKAIQVVLTAPDLYQHGRAYSNQFTNVFAGGPAFFALYPDAGMEKRLEDLIRRSSTEFQSPAGFFYEADGPDFGYNLNTHHHNVHMAWHYYRKTALAEVLIQQERLFCDWLAYNVVPEPGADFWALNRSIECRQRHLTVDPFDTPVAERCEIARAFSIAPAKRAADLREMRAALERDWPRVAELKAGNFWSYSPYTFLHRSQFHWHPSLQQIETAKARVPAWRKEPFIHQRMDSRHPQVYTYVRQAAYYAAFSSGPKIREQQRLGLGLVWTPGAGAILQSQSGGKETAWGAGVDGDLPATFEIGGNPISPQAGTRDLPAGVLRIRCALPGGGSKTIEFQPDRIKVVVEGRDRWTEFLPMLAGESGRPGWRINSEAQRSAFDSPPAPLFAGKRLAIVRLEGSGQGGYEILPLGS